MIEIRNTNIEMNNEVNFLKADIRGCNINAYKLTLEGCLCDIRIIGKTPYNII